MLSDNGKTFKAAAKSVQDVKWIFNVPKAPWWGGVFERMVRSTKRCLRKIIGQAKFSQDELLMAIVEVEMVINSWPLSYMSANDLEEPLTPSHLIVGRRLMNAPDHLSHGSDDEFDVTPDALTRRVRYLNSTILRFWERWRKEYLVGLREVHRGHRGNSSAPRVSVGDVVIIHSDDQPRGLWKLGRVEELLVGTDGEARGAVLRVAGQGRRAKLLRRPVQRLYPLELSYEQNQSENTAVKALDDEEQQDSPQLEEPSTMQNEPSDPPSLQPSTMQNEPSDTPSLQPLRRPRRAAASEARDRLLAQALDDSV